MRLIDADAVIVAVLDHGVDHVQTDDLEEINQIINDAPTIDVAPVVHAEWIVIAEYVDYVSARCGHCRVPQNFYHNKPLTKHCPNCGARMDGGIQDAVDRR